MAWADLMTGLALVLVIEGVLLALFPAAAKRMVGEILALPPQTLRLGGVAALALGVVLIWLVRG